MPKTPYGKPSRPIKRTLQNHYVLKCSKLAKGLLLLDRRLKMRLRRACIACKSKRPHNREDLDADIKTTSKEHATAAKQHQEDDTSFAVLQNSCDRQRRTAGYDASDLCGRPSRRPPISKQRRGSPKWSTALPQPQNLWVQLGRRIVCLFIYIHSALRRLKRAWGAC